MTDSETTFSQGIADKCVHNIEQFYLKIFILKFEHRKFLSEVISTVHLCFGLLSRIIIKTKKLSN